MCKNMQIEFFVLIISLMRSWGQSKRIKLQGQSKIENFLVGSAHLRFIEITTVQEWGGYDYQAD
jgi:hypothetical protein